MPEDDVKHIAVLNGLAFVAILADIHRLADPTRLVHGWVNGIKDLQVSYT